MAIRRGGRTAKIRLFGLTVLAVAVFIGVVSVVSAMSQSYRVVVATTMIPAGSQLTEGAYTIVEVSGVPPTVPNLESQFLSPDELDDYRGRLLTTTVYPGSILQKGDFYRPQTYDPSAPSQQYVYRLTELAGKDQRVVVIDGDPTSTFVQVGDYVDVYWIHEVPDPTTGSSENVVQKIFTKRVIYAIQRPLPPAQDDGSTTDTYTPPGTYFVLDLTAQEAQDLVYFQANGQLRIAIAAPNLTETTPTTITNKSYIEQTYGIVIPSPSPSAEPAPSTEPEPSIAPAPSPSTSPAP
jgi:Flp pilus assembly protein CpaB